MPVVNSAGQTMPAKETDAGGDEPRLLELKELIERASKLLPSQGPISAFVFLNPLEALEDLPFDEGVQKGGRLFGCHPYLPEDRYREKLATGRIRMEDLAAVLDHDLGDRRDVPIGPRGTVRDLRLAMLEHPLRIGPTEELRWFVAETDALTRIRPEVSRLLRERLIGETKHWVMRDLREICAKVNFKEAVPEFDGESSVVDMGDIAPADDGPHLLSDLIRHYGEDSIERWNAKTWEAFTLQALWRVANRGVSHLSLNFAPRGAAPAVRHRTLLLEATSVDSDTLVHEVLIRFCAAYCDQGFAGWQLPRRQEGFFRAFCGLYRQTGGPPQFWMHGLAKELARIEDARMTPLESIAESLQLLGVAESEVDEFLTTSLLALRGWAGLLWQMDVRCDRVALPAPPGTVTEFLAIRLVLERIALGYVAGISLDYHGPLGGLRNAARAHIDRAKPPDLDQRAFLIFQIAQVLGWSPAALYPLTREEWNQLISEVEGFNAIERRRCLHHAFERHFRVQALDAFAIHARRSHQRVPNPRFQSVYCIDAREESFRRHLEEIAPDAETFAAPGFFGVAMYYKGVADAHYSTLCPVVVMPKHWVVEEVVLSLEEDNRRRARVRQTLGAATHRVHMSSRGMAGGALLTAAFGVLASVPLVARVLFPRLTSRIRRSANRFVEAPRVTRLRLERSTPTPGSAGDQIGFSVDEMANMGEKMLRDIGLTSNFARLVIFFGHGSFCVNNPHKAAYDCGACSGSAGSPNARALATMLNDSRIRTILETRGLPIPRETVFLGGLHNTAEDSVSFFDLDLLPLSHKVDFQSARDTLELACERNAHERCRRFFSAPLDISLGGALRHVEGRAEDLAQTRPEFGNATNALCFVGRRSRNRELYLDRRSFMHSYDPAQDDEQGTILGRILTPVVPVCQGINLMYYFSYVDPPGWACGTKLPHNVASLLGVMDGAASDLRPGLPWQGVEIHEPMRLLFILESTPEKIRKIMGRIEVVRRIIQNGWVQLALLDPNSAEILVYQDDQFVPHVPSVNELPQAATSIDWYRGWREHLPFAQIGAPAATGHGIQHLDNPPNPGTE